MGDRSHKTISATAAAGLAVALAVGGIVWWHPWAGGPRSARAGDAPAADAAPAAVAAARPADDGDALFPPTLSPLELLTRCPQRSAPLEAWAARWQADPTHEPSDQDSDTLKVALASAKVPALVRFLIGKKVFEAKDVSTSMLWGGSGLERAKIEWADMATHDRADVDVQVRWEALAGAMSPFWQAGDLDNIGELLTVEHGMPPMSEWDQRPGWHAVNYAHLLLDHADPQDVIDYAKKVRADDTIDLRAEQLSKLNLTEATARAKLGDAQGAGTLVDAAVPKGYKDEIVDGVRARVKAAAEENGPDARPLAILRRHTSDKPLPQELLDWAKKWQPASAETGPVNEDVLARLTAKIAASDLTAAERLLIGKVLLNADDKPASAIWFIAAIDQTKVEFDAATTNSAATDASNRQGVAEQVLLPLMDRLEAAKAMLWDGVDPARNGAAEQKLIEMQLVLPRQDSNSQLPEWARIGHAEALHLQGRYDESLKEADAMVADMGKPDSQFRKEQKAGVHWIRALSLLSLERDDEAISELKETYAVKTFHHAADAGAVLVMKLTKRHQLNEAKAIIDESNRLHLVSILDFDAQSTLNVEVTMSALAERDRKAKHSAEVPTTMHSNVASAPSGVNKARQVQGVATAPSSDNSRAVSQVPEEELAAFREPRFAKALKIYTRNFAEYAKLRYTPVAPGDTIEDVLKALRPVVDRQLSNNDDHTRALVKTYGDAAITSLDRHLAIVLLRFAGLDAERYLAATKRERADRLYVPEAKAAYLLECSKLLPDVPIIIDETNQDGLNQIFKGLSAFQLKGSAGANNQIIGWSDDAKAVRLRFIEAQNNDVDSAILALYKPDSSATRNYYDGGIMLGSTIFTAPPLQIGSNKLVINFGVVVRTSNDFYTVRVSSYYDAESNVWHLREAVRCVSPRVAAAYPMIF